LVYCNIEAVQHGLHYALRPPKLQAESGTAKTISKLTTTSAVELFCRRSHYWQNNGLKKFWLKLAQKTESRDSSSIVAYPRHPKVTRRPSRSALSSSIRSGVGSSWLPSGCALVVAGWRVEYPGRVINSGVTIKERL
jgi:hypothetical protein